MLGHRRGDRRHDAGGRHDRHGGRPDRDPQQRSNHPPEQQGREPQARRGVVKRAADAGRVEHPAESAAGAHHQQHRGNRREALLAEAQDLLPGRGRTPCRTPGTRRGRPAVIATIGLPANSAAARSLPPPGHTTAAAVAPSISAIGSRMAKSVDAEAGTRPALLAPRSAPSRARPARPRCGGSTSHPSGGPTTSAAGRPMASDQPIVPAHVRVQPLDGRERPGVRRHEPVRGREPRHERQADEQQRQPLSSGQREHDRRDEHEPDAEEHRQADDERRRARLAQCTCRTPNRPNQPARRRRRRRPTPPASCRPSSRGR